MHSRQDKDIIEPSIFTAARSGNISLLADCIIKINHSCNPEVAINDRGPDGGTALYLAAANGHTKAVQLLLSIPGIKTNDMHKIAYRTPLQIAALHGHAPCTQVLLDAPGTDVNAIDYRGNTALILAAMQGHTACVQVLLAHPDIDLYATDDSFLMGTAICHATYGGHTACVQAILAAPGFFKHPHATMEFDRALYVAADNGDIACVQALLASPNADLNLHHRDRHKLYEQLFANLTRYHKMAEASSTGVYQKRPADIYEMIINLILKAALKAKLTLNATATNSTDASKNDPNDIAAHNTSKSAVDTFKLFGTSTARQAAFLTRQDNEEIKYPRASL